MKGDKIVVDPQKIKCEYLNGIYSELADQFGIEIVLQFHSTYRGQQIFYPVDLFSKEFIRKQIIEEYNGYNVKQLATKYGYTEKWVKKILKEHIDGESKG